jgi:hypothetical protein
MINIIDKKSTRYILCIRDDYFSQELNFEEKPSEKEIEEKVKNWISDGSWGDEGASIHVIWILKKNEEEIDNGSIIVEIETNHNYLIAEATANCPWSCGNNPEDHDWVNEGIWGAGGSALDFYSHCKNCELYRQEYHPGAHCNLQDHNTVNYTMLYSNLKNYFQK